MRCATVMYRYDVCILKANHFAHVQGLTNTNRFQAVSGLHIQQLDSPPTSSACQYSSALKYVRTAKALQMRNTAR
jgi:hypothetical protein